jgi:hypothetical protein
MMQQGEYLRHRARPEWGIGQVLTRGEDRIDVQFGHALVALKLSVASIYLERVSKAEAALAGVDTAPARAAKKTRAPKKTTPKPAV